MALDTATAKNAAVDGLKAKITHIAVFSSAASGTAGIEQPVRLVGGFRVT